MSMEMTVARGCIASPAKSPKIGTPIVQTGKAEPPSPVKRVSASPSKRMDPKSPVRPASPALPGSPRRGHEHCHKPAAESPKAQRPVSPSKPAWGSPAAARAPASPTKLTPAKRRPSAPSTPSTTRVAPSAAGANGPSTPRSAAKAGPATPSRFRQSILGGSPATSYKHSPARRLATPNSVMRTPPPSTPPSRAHLPGLSNSARKASPSPRARALRSAAFRGRKSVGAAVMTGEGGRAFAARRRSSIMAAILPMREDESFDVSTSSANAEDSKLAEQDPSGSGSGGAREGATESAERIQLRLPLSEFLGLVGLKFHDDMSANKRRPTPPALLDLNADNKSEQGKTADTNVMGQVKAEAAAAPMLEALREVSVQRFTSTL